MIRSETSIGEEEGQTQLRPWLGSDENMSNCWISFWASCWGSCLEGISYFDDLFSRRNKVAQVRLKNDFWQICIHQTLGYEVPKIVVQPDTPIRSHRTSRYPSQEDIFKISNPIIQFINK